MTGDGAAGERARRGTPLQRARAALVAALAGILQALPAPVAGGLADSVGELWYRVAPARAAVARGNLAHLAWWLAAEGRGPARARAAAADPAALERLVRASFRHLARTYVETLRGAQAAAHDLRAHLVLETPEAVEAALATPGPVIYATPHFGSMMVVAAVLYERSPVPITAPMETLGDPELQRVMRRARESGGVRTVEIRSARRELRAALERGEGVGVVADRDLTGGGIAVPFFGRPATLPIGAVFLALETGAPLHVAAGRRIPGERFAGGLVTLPHPPAGLPRRQRVEALLASEARAFEDIIAAAPEQWWAIFFPIWEGVGPLPKDAPLPPFRPGGAP